MPLATKTLNDIVNQLTAKQGWTMATNNYVGFSSTLPTVAGANITEPTGGGYSRKLLAGSNMTTSANGSSLNIAEVVFDTATADWLAGANLGYITVWRSQTGTTATDFVGWAVATTPRPVLNGNVARIPASSIVMTVS